MKRHLWAAPLIVLYFTLAGAILLDTAWLACLCIMPLAYLMGRRDWLHIERYRVEVRVEARHQQEKHDLNFQLAHFERVLAERDEADHAAIRGDAWPSNGAGHYSPAFTDDSPARQDAGQPQQGVS